MNPPQTPPSIFNDVIGPIMRGPSSSHTAAAVRIGRLARDLMDGQIEEVLIEFDPHGSLATTHESQGSDMGLFGGLLGWDATDPRLVDSTNAIRQSGIQVEIRIQPIGATHPNTYQITLSSARERRTMTALSTGGGMIRITEIDSAALDIAGDYFETLIYVDAGGQEVSDYLIQDVPEGAVFLRQGPEGDIVQVQAARFLEMSQLAELRTRFDVRFVKQLSPVLPVLSSGEMRVPFTTCQEMLAYNQGLDLPLWELAVRYESARGGISQDQVLSQMLEVVRLMQASIHEGIQGTQYADRILGHQSGAFQQRMQEGRLLDGGLLNTMILYVTAMMEQKSAMGVIVAAPTAGACGGLPGAVIGAGEVMGLTQEQMAKSMLAAGIVGVFIASGATFAAEVCGCQAETGAGSTMAAAALVDLAGGDAVQAVGAASVALQNILGLICDPVANRVEVPCLGRNVMAASNALACANMALAGFDPVIPLDETIETMYAVGNSLPHELRCTGLGGLSVTDTSKQIELRLLS